MFVRSRSLLLSTVVICLVSIVGLLPRPVRAGSGSRDAGRARDNQRRVHHEKEALVAMYWLGLANAAYTVLFSGQLEGLSGLGLMLGSKLIYDRLPDLDQLGVERPFGVGVSRRNRQKVDPSFFGWDLLLPSEGMAQMTGEWVKQARRLGLGGTVAKLVRPAYQRIDWAGGRVRLFNAAWKGRRALHP